MQRSQATLLPFTPCVRVSLVSFCPPSLVAAVLILEQPLPLHQQIARDMAATQQLQPQPQPTVWLFLGSEAEDADDVIANQSSNLWPLLSQMLATVRTSNVVRVKPKQPQPIVGRFQINRNGPTTDDQVRAVESTMRSADADGCCTAQGEACRLALTWWKHTEDTDTKNGVYFGMYTTADQVGLLAMVQAPPDTEDPPPAFVRDSLNAMLHKKSSFPVFRRAASILKSSLESWRAPLNVRAAVEQLIDPTSRGLPESARIGRVWTVGASGPGAVGTDSQRAASPARALRSREDDDSELLSPYKRRPGSPQPQSPDSARFVSPIKSRSPGSPGTGYAGVGGTGTGGGYASSRYPSPVIRRWNQQVGN